MYGCDDVLHVGGGHQEVCGQRRADGQGRGVCDSGAVRGLCAGHLRRLQQRGGTACGKGLSGVKETGPVAVRKQSLAGGTGKGETYV